MKAGGCFAVFDQKSTACKIDLEGLCGKEIKICSFTMNSFINTRLIRQHKGTQASFPLSPLICCLTNGKIF